MSFNRQSSIGKPESLIAWCGWRIEVPEEWRPLKIKGERDKGSMMIGDGDRPLLLVQWRRVTHGSFDSREWLSRRFAKQRATPNTGAPHPPGFDVVGWVRELELREGQIKSVWYGYSRQAGLLLELVTTRLADGDPGPRILEGVLPSLRVSMLDEPCQWSLFGVTCVSPAGFELERRHLYSGDIAIQLRKGRNEALLLRQVYPAGMAVERRPLSVWLERTPFTERRRAPKDPPEKWEGTGTWGVFRRGWRRLRSPMGWCNPRYSTAIAAVDGKRDRLLIVEHLTRRQHGDDCVKWCVETMNS